MSHYEIALGRARQGEQFLDNNVDYSWREQINLDTLDLRSVYNCVLSQATGRAYDGALRELAISETIASACGFTKNINDYSITWDDLNEAWQDVLSNTVGNDEPKPVSVHIITDSGGTVRLVTTNEEKLDTWIDVLNQMDVDYTAESHKVEA